MAKKFISLENLLSFYNQLKTKFASSEELTTVKGKVGTLETKTGTATLETTAKDLSGAVNELKTGKLDIGATAASANKLANARNINITGGATGSASFDGSADANINLTIGNISADKIVGGKLSIDVIPDSAIERMIVVNNEEAMLLLTKKQIQKGDVVKLADTGLMYYVKSEDALSKDGVAPAVKDNAFEEFKVGTAAKVDWSGVQNIPSDVQNITSLLAGKANSIHTQTHSDITDFNESVVAVDLTGNSQVSALRNDLDAFKNDTSSIVKVDKSTIVYTGAGSPEDPKKLSVGNISQDKVTGLTAALSNKVENSVFTPVSEQVTANKSDISNIKDGSTPVGKVANAITLSIGGESTVYDGSAAKNITIEFATEEEIQGIFAQI